MYHLRRLPGSGLSAHNAAHVGTGLASGHSAAARDFETIRSRARGREELVDEMAGAAAAGLVRAQAMLAAAHRAAQRRAVRARRRGAARSATRCARSCWPPSAGGRSGHRPRLAVSQPSEPGSTVTETRRAGSPRCATRPGCSRCSGPARPTSACPSWPGGWSLGKSTVHRLLTTLVAEGLIEQNPRTGGYRLGIVMFELGEAVRVHMDLHAAAGPVLGELRAQTGESSQVGVLDGHEVVYVDRMESAHSLRLFTETGRRVPVHCTSSGKVLLAHLPEARRQVVLRAAPFTA